MNEIIRQLPKLKTGEELKQALTVLPEYGEHICEEDESIRLMALSDIYKIYLPSSMTTEIYSKVYLSMLRSLQKKNTKSAVIQRNENYRQIQNQSYRGIIGGSDSFTIIGNSGVGKSSAIMGSIAVATDNLILEIEHPYMRIIPCVICQCPHDCSVKGLLLEILRKVDEILDSQYYEQAIRARATTDMLIGCVSQVSLNHIGLLVVDEIQNVCNHRNGTNLVSMLTQLINNSGISICMVGTPESTKFFENEMQLARRSLGLQYGALEYNEYFKYLCETVYQYQYVKNRTEISDMVIEWLYEHSSGLVSVVISLIHDAQEIAIMTGKEVLNIETLDIAYQERMKMLHGYIQPSILTKKQTTTKKKTEKKEKAEESKQIQRESVNLYELIMEARKNEGNIVELLKTYVSVLEVCV